MNNFEPIVKIRGMTKLFKKKKALDAVNLDIMPGRIIGLIGPNGSGRSTLLRHIIGLYLPSRGSCVTFGCEAAKLGPKELSRIGYVHQEGELLDWMTVGQLIRYVSAYYPAWNKDLEDRYVRDFEIDLNERIGPLSPGQRQKVAILLAIGHEPDFLILDEPGSALDPLTKAQFLELLLKIIQREGKTIIMSSHILSDVEKVIDHTIIMKEGRVVRDQDLDELRESYIRVRLTSLGKVLPEELSFEKALSYQRDKYQAFITIERSYVELLKYEAETLNCRIDNHPLPLEEIYKIIIEQRK